MFLERVVEGQEGAELPERIAASKSLLPYGKASLSSIQQTVKEEPANEAEIMASLAHLLSANSGALRQLVESDPTLRATLQSVIQGGPVAVNAPQQSSEKAA